MLALHHFSVVMDLDANDLQLGHHPEIAVSVCERIQWRQMRKACRSWTNNVLLSFNPEDLLAVT